MTNCSIDPGRRKHAPTLPYAAILDHNSKFQHGPWREIDLSKGSFFAATKTEVPFPSRPGNAQRLEKHFIGEFRKRFARDTFNDSPSGKKAARAIACLRTRISDHW